jgi:hypothetical protein
MYPKDWPKCVRCDDDALDGHLTCGRAECNESRARDERSFFSGIATCPHGVFMGPCDECGTPYPITQAKK